MGGRLRAGVLALGLMLGSAPRASLAAPEAHADRPNPALARVVESYWQEHLRLRPLHATMFGDHRYDGELPDSLSSAQLGREYALEKRALTALLALNTASLSPRDRVTYDTFRWERDLEIEGFRYPAELMPIAPYGGLPALMAQYGSGTGAQPFATVRDYDNWLRRLDAYATWLEHAVVNLRRGLSRGYVMPKVEVARIVPQVAAIADAPVEDSLFMRPVRTMPATIPAPEQARLRTAYREAIQKRLMPAYRRLRDFLERDYLPRARDGIGWGDLPQGRAWYAYRARRATTSALTPDQIHHLGLDEVRRLAPDADRLAAELGLHGDRHANFEALRGEGRGTFERDEDVVTAVNALSVRIRQRLPEFIDVSARPEFGMQVVEPSHAAGVAALTFRPGSADGKRAPLLLVNPAELRTRPRYELDAAYLREVEPGRALALSMVANTASLPRFRRFGAYLAFAEGWGLYAEELGREYGLFADAASQFAALSIEVLRAARVVVDTGIHAEGWSRDKAIEYLVANTILNAQDAGAEVDRIVSTPAQALAYEVGAIRLRAMRARAAQALGPRFDLRAFHRQLLANGPLPLDVADRELTRWLAAQGAAR